MEINSVMIMAGERNPMPDPFFPPQIKHGTNLAQTQVSAMRGL
jgi:hypothetical protein